MQKCLSLITKNFTFYLSNLFFLLWKFSISFHIENNFYFFLFFSTFFSGLPHSGADPHPIQSYVRNSKNYFFFTSLFDFSGFSLYQADVSLGSIHSSSLSSLSLSESVSSMATRRARIDATSWRFDCFWWRMSSRSCSTLRSLIPKSGGKGVVSDNKDVARQQLYHLESPASNRLERSRRRLARDSLVVQLCVTQHLRKKERNNEQPNTYRHNGHSTHHSQSALEDPHVNCWV